MGESCVGGGDCLGEESCAGGENFVGEESRRESAPQQLLVGVRMDWRRENGLVVMGVVVSEKELLHRRREGDERGLSPKDLICPTSLSHLLTVRSTRESAFHSSCLLRNAVSPVL